MIILVDLYEKIIIACSGVFIGFLLNLLYSYLKYRYEFLLTQKALAHIFVIEIDKFVSQTLNSETIDTSFYDENKIELAKYLPKQLIAYSNCLNGYYDTKEDLLEKINILRIKLDNVINKSFISSLIKPSV